MKKMGTKVYKWWPIWEQWLCFISGDKNWPSWKNDDRDQDNDSNKDNDKDNPRTFDIWDTDYNSDNWDPDFNQGYMTINCDNICDYCDVLINTNSTLFHVKDLDESNELKRGPHLTFKKLPALYFQTVSSSP